MDAKLCAHVERVRLLEGDLAGALPSLMGSGVGEDRSVTLRVAVNADSLGSWFLPAAARFTERSGALLDVVLDGEELCRDRESRLHTSALRGRRRCDCLGSRAGPAVRPKG